MTISKKHQNLTLLIWIMIVPPCVYWVYLSFPSVEVDLYHLFLMVLTLLVTMLVPLRFETMTVSMERWVTFALFFQYGAFVELIFTQIALLILLFIRKTGVPTLYRFCVNSTTFALVSAMSALVFHQVGGSIGNVDVIPLLWTGALYAMTYTIVNTLVLHLYLFFEPGPTFLKTNWQYTIWDFMMTMAIFPFSVALYFLYVELQHKALLLMGIPFLFILLIAQLYNRSDHLNAKLTSASHIGHELAKHLDCDGVVKTFITKLKDVVSYENAYIFDRSDSEYPVVLMGSESNELTMAPTKIQFHPLSMTDGLLSLNDPQTFGRRKALKSLQHFSFDRSIHSVLTVPVKRRDRIEGFLILTSSKRNHFQPIDVKIVELLSGYLAATLLKARLYEKTTERSERCGLTGLYNFSFLESKLEEEMIRYHTGEMNALSLCIFDLDFFKQVNDTYGHQSGNDILIAVANFLKDYRQEGDTLARYGGEEFVLLLPNRSKEEAIQLAQQIRKNLASTLFRIVPDLDEYHESIDIQITCSIGVATVPDDAQSSRTLLRHADKALYIGGKRAGRNRVGVYGEDSIQTVV